MTKKITIVVSDEVFERLKQIKESSPMGNWADFFVFCVIEYCKHGLELCGSAYKRDITVLQNHLKD